MVQPTGQSLFAEITSLNGPRSGVMNVRFIGPGLGQREVAIITDLVRAAIEKAGSSLRFLVLDLSQITFMNSMALGMCIDFRNRVNRIGGKTALLGMNEQLSELVRMVKVDKLYSIVKDHTELQTVIGS
jgi:anti-anti-sigma factor